MGNMVGVRQEELERVLSLGQNEVILRLPPAKVDVVIVGWNRPVERG
jgi:hypothetical protein